MWHEHEGWGEGWPPTRVVRRGPGGWRRGPGGPDGRRMRRGGIRRAVLSALQEGPAHGYEVMRRLEQRTGGMWRPSPGSVYPTLQMLEDEGLVRAEESGGTRTYTLTEAGEAEAQAAAEAGPGPFGGGPGGRPLRPLIEAMGQLEAAVHGVARSGDEGRVEQAANLVRETARQIHGLLAGAPGDDL